MHVEADVDRFRHSKQLTEADLREMEQGLQKIDHDWEYQLVQ